MTRLYLSRLAGNRFVIRVSIDGVHIEPAHIDPSDGSLWISGGI